MTRPDPRPPSPHEVLLWWALAVLASILVWVVLVWSAVEVVT